MRALASLFVVLVLCAPACAPGTRLEAPVPATRPVAAGPVAAKPVAAKPVAAKSVAAKRVAAKAVAAKPVAAKPAAAKARAAATKPPVRTARVDSTALEFAVTAQHAHRPLTQALSKRTRNPAMAERAAWAVIREAGQLKVSPSLLAAVLLIENRALDSSAVSSQGAVGLMQVMPFHAGSYGCASADLQTVDANICHGARILHSYMKRTQSVPRALRRYNGCVSGSNTPGCHRYPVRVLRTAARIRREILATPPTM
jgi:soluble lytic murein transglycosylase-like protein